MRHNYIKFVLNLPIEEQREIMRDIFGLDEFEFMTSYSGIISENNIEPERKTVKVEELSKIQIELLIGEIVKRLDNFEEYRKNNPKMKEIKEKLYEELIKWIDGTE